MKKILIYILSFSFVMFLGINDISAQKAKTSKGSEISIEDRIERSFKAWSKRLHLSPEQQLKVKPLFSNYMNRMYSVRISKELSLEEKKEKGAILRKELEVEFSKLLTDKQKPLFESKKRKSK